MVGARLHRTSQGNTHFQAAKKSAKLLEKSAKCFANFFRAFFIVSHAAGMEESESVCGRRGSRLEPPRFRTAGAAPELERPKERERDQGPCVEARTGSRISEWAENERGVQWRPGVKTGGWHGHTRPWCRVGLCVWVRERGGVRHPRIHHTPGLGCKDCVCVMEKN